MHVGNIVALNPVQWDEFISSKHTERDKRQLLQNQGVQNKVVQYFVKDNHAALYDTTRSHRDNVQTHNTKLQQIFGGRSTLLRHLNDLRKTRIRWEIKFVFLFQNPVI
jgi:uncharacterized protein YigA (DUF484 family)